MKMIKGAPAMAKRATMSSKQFVVRFQVSKPNFFSYHCSLLPPPKSKVPFEISCRNFIELSLPNDNSSLILSFFPAVFFFLPSAKMAASLLSQQQQQSKTMRRNSNQFLAQFLLFLFAHQLPSAVWADVIEQLTRQGSAIIADAKIVGGETRQCTCEEQRECINEMQGQAMGCVNQCWSTFGSITARPDTLRKCFGRADVLIGQFITCFEDNVDSCLPQRADVKIPKVNITELFRLGVDKIEKTKQQLTRSLSDGPIRKIIDTASDFGICVKDCFLAKNPDQFCFDRKDCQPLLLDNKAKKSLRQCTKLIDWKKEAGELCECSVKAGINDLEQYCPMLKLIGGRANGGGGNGGRKTTTTQGRK